MSELTQAEKRRLARELRELHERMEDNRVMLRVLLLNALKNRGVEGWRKRAAMVDELIADAGEDTA